MSALKVVVLATHDEQNGLATIVHPDMETAYEELRRVFLGDEINRDAEIDPLPEGASINDIIDAASMLPQFAFDVTEHEVGGYGWGED